MGVILKVLHRNEDLKKPTHRNLFLDMEENIHIHYRDLRIELSRNEFENIVHTFGLQSAELMEIIKKKKYQDGVLPNANRESVTIWTESKLKNDVVFHPQRISLEECTDGYHLHLRNYKILLDNDDFATLADAFKSIDLDAPYASTPKEVMELLDANHVHYVERNEKNAGTRIDGKQVKRIVVADYHELKIRGILNGIGMERKVDDNVHNYSKEKLVFSVVMSNNKALFTDRIKNVEKPMLPLVDYFSREQPMDTDRLNTLKAKVLDIFSYVEKSGLTTNINLNYKSWIYDIINDEIVFPFNSAQNKPDTTKLYRAWSNFLKGKDMYFIKPTKVLLDEKRQQKLHKQIFEKIEKEVTSVACVSKIYIMGSVMRNGMGLYKSPFIHSRWAKLGSDVDLLFEVDEKKPVKFPDSWNYINISSGNQCDIYHVGEIGADDDFGHRQRYPNINYFQHLLDAYVYIPSKGDLEKKNAFLKKFKAELIFDRGAGEGVKIIAGKKPEKAATKTTKKNTSNAQKALVREFGEAVQGLNRLDVATENELYEVEVKGEAAILKIYKVSGNYSSSKLVEHTEYECQVITAAEKRGVPTASIVPTNAGNNVFMVDENAAVLFKKVEGVLGSEPNFPVEETAKALAIFHEVQIKKPIDIKTEFSFDLVFDIWRVEFNRYAEESKNDEELSQAFAKLEVIYKEIKKIYRALTTMKGIVWLHNHGDVTPRNTITSEGKTYLFDFQNTFHGPRLLDLIEGGIEFSWGIKNAKLNDFNRFDQFTKCYLLNSKLTANEKKSLENTIKVLGLIKFIKEVRMIKGSKNKNNLRRLRALDLFKFMEARSLTKKKRRRRR